MRVFQNSAIYANYRPRFDELARAAKDFAERRRIFLDDRFGACHFLKPVLDQEPSAFFTNGDDEILQRMWAREHGLPESCSMEDILLSQIEECRAEVFYNLDPMRYSSAFVRRLPSRVRRTVAWRAAPSPGADFSAYGCVVSNFPGILEDYRSRGWRAEYFFPAHDPVMDQYASTGERPTDVMFVGGYSRHHRSRARLLEAVAALQGNFRIALHLDCSRLTALAESALGRLLPLARERRPAAVRRVATGPVYGRELYAALGRSKIVVNGAIDMAGRDRGNMRCWEAMGTQCLLLSDDGNYPAGMADRDTMRTYRSIDEAVSLIGELLRDRNQLAAVAAAGHGMVQARYSKEVQWRAFQRLVD